VKGGKKLSNMSLMSPSPVGCFRKGPCCVVAKAAVWRQLCQGWARDRSRVGGVISFYRIYSRACAQKSSWRNNLQALVESSFIKCKTHLRPELRAVIKTMHPRGGQKHSFPNEHAVASPAC
jgi:hypothetical protein